MHASAFRMPPVKEFPYKDLWPVEQHSVTLMPDWLYKYLTNKGLGGDYLLTDLVLDEKLSVEDIGCIVFLNSVGFPCFDDGKSCPAYDMRIPQLSTYHLSMEMYKLRPAHNDRMATRIRSACDSAWTSRVRNDIEQRLGGVCSENQPSYEFIVTGPKIWLIVKAGFLSMLKDPSLRLSFYRDYLSTVGKIAPARAVTHTAVFANWVAELVG